MNFCSAAPPRALSCRAVRTSCSRDSLVLHRLLQLLLLDLEGVKELIHLLLRHVLHLQLVHLLLQRHVRRLDRPEVALRFGELLSQRSDLVVGGLPPAAASCDLVAASSSSSAPMRFWHPANSACWLLKLTTSTPYFFCSASRSFSPAPLSGRQACAFTRASDTRAVV